MILEPKDNGKNDIYGSQLMEVKSEEQNSKQTEYESTSIVSSRKFKPRKRKIGNLILKTSSFVEGENDNGNFEGNDEMLESSDRSFRVTLSGILSKFLHIKQLTSFNEAPDGIKNSEYLHTTLQDEFGERKSTRGGLSRVFETYRRRNDLKTLKQCEEYHDSNLEKEKNFNRFFKLEQALDAKGEENTLTSTNKEPNMDSYASKDLSVGSSLKDDLQEISESCSKTKLLLDDPPKAESAALENTVFSPNTHRPSLRDIPGIENIEVSSPVAEKYYNTISRAFKIRSNKSIIYGTSSKPQDPHFSKLDEEIDSHLYNHSRRNLLSRCFPSKKLVCHDIMREAHNENTDFAPDLESYKQIPEEQIATIPTTPNSLSESFTAALKGILQQKYKSSFSRDKNKRRNLSVRFVSPILSPIEMTNNVENSNDHNNTEVISHLTE